MGNDLMNTRKATLAILFAVGCAQGNSSDSSQEPPLPARNGENGEAGAAGEAGPPGPKGDPGVVGVTEAIGNHPGGAIISGPFTSTGGKLMITLSGSGYRTGTAGTLGFDVSIDTMNVGAFNGFTNELASHKVLPVRTLVVSGVAAGNHTITIAPQANTITDINDYFNATVLELH
jgi:hypothetical protein